MGKGCAGEQGSEYTYNTMIKVASYAGDFERALAVLDDMEAAGVAPTAAIWGSLLVACGKVCPSSSLAVRDRINHAERRVVRQPLLALRVLRHAAPMWSLDFAALVSMHVLRC